MDSVKRKFIRSPKLPLAVYREVVAHLKQVLEVKVGLIEKSRDGGRESFDYSESQIEGLWIEYSDRIDTESKQRIDGILDYYGKRYQSWETVIKEKGQD